MTSYEVEPATMILFSHNTITYSLMLCMGEQSTVFSYDLLRLLMG